MTKKKLIGLIVSLAVALTAWFLPPDVFGIANLSVVEQRVIAIFLFAALMWISEAIPIWTTSVVVIVVLLLTISDSSLWFLRGENIEGARAFGQIVKYKAILATFADPIIMLFLGGFILAIAAGKCSLDNNLARILIKPFGTRSEIVLLGLMLVTAMFSMFMSNTATTAMMFAVMAPILKPMEGGGKGRIGMTLAIPVAANIGGIGTPIGTPPNAIALKYLNDPEGLNMGIGFGEWMSIMVPFVIISLLFAWVVMVKLFPFNRKNIEVKFTGSFEKSKKAYIIYVTFAVTVILWMLDKLTGLDANVVAMIPVAVFCATGVITKEDLKKINWEVLWLVAGGFALGVALQGTGLAKDLVASIPFATWSPIMTIIGAGLLCYAMSTFMSHTATSALLVPVLAAVGVGMGDTLVPYGGISTLLIGVALSASLAMALPISTPPNAIAHATGLTTQKEMATVGIIVAVFSLTLAYIMLFTLGSSLL